MGEKEKESQTSEASSSEDNEWMNSFVFVHVKWMINFNQT